VKGVVGLIVGFAALAWPAPAQACSCIGPGPSSAAFKRADLVFAGAVTRVDGLSRINADGSVRVGLPTVTSFSVAKVFKGAPVLELSITGEGNNCDIPFGPGETWVVYASTHDGRVTAGKCTRTRVRAEAAQDLAYLEGLEQGRPQGLVYGDVHRRIVGPDGSPGLRALVEPLDVIATGAGRRFTVTTDRWGPYQLVLPPGEFQVWVERGGRAVAPRQSVRIEDGSERRLMLVAEFPEPAKAQQPARDTPALALARAEAKWHAHGPASYEFGVILTCFCSPKGMNFRVVEGRVQFPDRANATTTRFHDAYGTIESLFAKIRQAIDAGGHRIDVKYHADLGYPIWADLDPRREIKDDELFIRVTAFRAASEAPALGLARRGARCPVGLQEPCEAEGQAGAAEARSSPPGLKPRPTPPIIFKDGHRSTFLVPDVPDV
jgi:hypothetical protein